MWGHGHMVGYHHLGFGRELDRDPAFALLFGFDDIQWRRRFLPGNPAVIASRHSFHLIHIEVADEERHGVVGCVELPVIGLKLVPCHRLNVTHPSHDRPAVRTCFECGSEQLVDEHAFGVILIQSSFLCDNIPFRIELPEDGVLHSVGLEHHPQFEPVCGKINHVAGDIVRGEGIQHPAPVLNISVPQLVLDYEFAMLDHDLLETKLLTLKVGIKIKVIHPAFSQQGRVVLGLSGDTAA